MINLLIEADRVELLAGAPQPVDVPRDDGPPSASSGAPPARWRSTASTAPGGAFRPRRDARRPVAVAPDVHIFTRSKLRWVTLPESTCPASRSTTSTKTLWPGRQSRAALAAAPAGPPIGRLRSGRRHRCVRPGRAGDPRPRGTLERLDALAGEAAGAGAELVLSRGVRAPATRPTAGCATSPPARTPAARATFARLMRESVEVPGPGMRPPRGDGETPQPVAGGRRQRAQRRDALQLAARLRARRGASPSTTASSCRPTTSGSCGGWATDRASDTVDAGFGRVGGLICWEMNMPLARFALYQDGLEILLAPTADDSDAWHDSMRHIAREAALLRHHLEVFLRASSASGRRAAGGRRRSDETAAGSAILGSRRELPRRPALGRAGHPHGDARPGPPRRGAAALRPGRPLPPAGRLPPVRRLGLARLREQPGHVERQRDHRRHCRRRRVATRPLSRSW